MVVSTFTYVEESLESFFSFGEETFKKRLTRFYSVGDTSLLVEMSSPVKEEFMKVDS